MVKVFEKSWPSGGVWTGSHADLIVIRKDTEVIVSFSSDMAALTSLIRLGCQNFEMVQLLEKKNIEYKIIVTLNYIIFETFHSLEVRGT